MKMNKMIKQNLNKKGAMEMSVGTIVTIVLLMTVMVLGLVLVRSIFSGAKDNIDDVNEAVNDQIKKLFNEDNTKKIVIIPNSRDVKLKKGDDGKGFGIAIRNNGESANFNYDISAEEVSCEGVKLREADDLIVLNQKRSGIPIAGGNIMEEAHHIKFSIPENFPPCLIAYSVEVERDREPYASLDVYVEIEGK